MELWVRTQDKKALVNCRIILMEEFRTQFRLYSNDYGTLGKYETKERCLEILDEIQKLLLADPTPLLVFTNCDITKDTYDGLNEAYKNGDLLALCANSVSDNVKVFEKSTVVYEMPEK